MLCPDIRKALRRALWPHLPLFGGGGVLATWLLPHGAWKLLPAAALVAQAIRGELNDVRNGEDSVCKAIIDGLTQALPALVAGLLAGI
jgi:hypothetical protein